MNDLHLRNLPVPFFSQRKNTYIYEERYTQDEANKKGNLYLAGKIKPDGHKYSMACNSCNITSVTMVLHYFGITEEKPDAIMKRFFERETATDKIALGTLPTAENALESWKTLEACINGLYKEKIRILFGERVANTFVTYYHADPSESSNGKLSISKIKESIAHGYPVIVNYGTLKDFWSTTGHIIVIRGFSKIKGKEYVIINDPWGVPTNKNEKFKTESQGTLPGVYYESLYYDFSNYAGGTGDNCTIPLSEFQKVINTDGVSSALIIKAPLWNYPDGSVIDGSTSVYQKEIPDGSGFPLRLSSLWHNGIHLHTGGAVHSIGAGRLVAARSDLNPPETGDTGFLLVRHNTVVDSKTKTFYALYMHTKPLDLTQYASRLFSHGIADQDIKWPYQLFSHMLPAHYVVFTGNNGQNESGLINETFRNIPVYNAVCIDGNFHKRERSSITLEQRILINPLPVTPALFNKLLDPSHYGDSDFLSGMTHKTSFEKTIGTEKYIFFFHKGSLVCTSIDGQTFTTKGLINKKQFQIAAEKLSSLAKGNVTAFTDSVQPDSELSISSIVKNIYTAAWGTSVFDATLIAEKENWNVSFERLTQKTQSLTSAVATVDDAQCFVQVLENIYSLNDGNTVIEKKNDVERALTDFTKKYAKARKTALEKYLSAVQKTNDEKEISENDIIRSEAAGKSMNILKQRCTDILRTINETCGTSLSDTTVGTQPTGDATIRALVKVLESEADKIPYAIKKNAFEYIAVSLINVPAELVLPLNGKEDYFRTTDGSIKQLLNEYVALFEKTGIRYKSALSTLASDSFIEFGKREKIAACGTYKENPADRNGRQLLHFEIFSAEEILSVEPSLQIKDTDSTSYFDPLHCIELFKTVIPESYRAQLPQLEYDFISREQMQLLYGNLTNIRDGAYRHISEWADIDWKKTFNDSTYIHRQVSVYDPQQQKCILMSKDAFIENYHTPYMWMRPDVFPAESRSFTDNCAWYYHPLHFLQKIGS